MLCNLQFSDPRRCRDVGLEDEGRDGGETGGRGKRDRGMLSHLQRAA